MSDVDFAFDDCGWCTEAVTPLAPEAALSVLSPALDGRIDLRLWNPHASRLAGAWIEVQPAKRFPGATSPNADRAQVVVHEGGRDAFVVSVRTFPSERGSAVMRAAREAAARMPDGMDALVPRTRRLWQIQLGEGVDERAAWLLAGAIAQQTLGPILPPDGARLVGPATVRARLDAG